MLMVSQTDIGRVRLVNEDRAVVQQELNGLSLAIVADGMGGHQAGDIASQMAIERIQAGLQVVRSEMSIEERKRRLIQAIEAANETIFEFATQRENYHGMGTTVVVVLASQELLLIGHIGDSRAYKINSESILQLTEDHSLVNELVKTGQITAEEASEHPRRNVLLRALGTEPGVEVDIYEYTWKPGDVVLLCTDGLSGLIDVDMIWNHVKKEANLELAAQQLIQSALDAGGDDNVTVILLKHSQDIDTAEGKG
ncbi:Stp1/IreP family PP2C-type Ser/Thr phosphatase [Paenibacillus eucommiae]|uniref:Protein phosphatase n=1 Tax=Paenibacillus eucommiae TaxID=1355755 RepID=A0ABS4IV12_9BACL|nr:Stp1/IreP family PP2C-type Ser/Thr phosphatase [Paenibacillus eucommiae]MBP1991432.1 protein phosphatase [Paenibacillus eucommiae]